MEGFSGQLPFLLLMLVVFFFFIILPQQRRQKKEKNFMLGLKKGDRIVTKSGMHGKVVELNDKDNTCVVETLAGKIKMERSAISLELSAKLQPKSTK
ncbi:MAG: preprotein translocase subunit YajC [Flavobacteriaceae bacterium]|jgi:preprotein translocase subunit YajC